MLCRITIRQSIYVADDLHSDLPLAPEPMKVTPDMLSDYNTDTNLVGQTSLVPNLFGKSHYILHIRNLKQYTPLGMEVSRIHKVLAFDQKAYLAPYIQFNTKKEKASTFWF